jgi:hypothetical protein
MDELYGSRAMRFVKASTVGIVSGTVGTLLLLTFAMICQPMPNAQATPAIGKGQPCNTCHTSSRPNKSDLKK